METPSVISAILLLLQVLSPVHSQQPDCQTPRGTYGNCIGLSECSELLQLLQARRPENYEYLKQSQCGFQDRDPMVCCPLSGATNIEDVNTGDRDNAGAWDLSSNPLIPQICGEDLSQRLLGGTKADIYEFPWMALLEYTKPNGRTTACGGVLISQRYVLTAAHCIKGKDLPKSWNLVNVRLGEYDTSRARDCIPDGNGNEICTEDPVTVGIEQQIVHEQYRPESRDQLNDIALLRLSRNVAFTNYIRPICLPPSSSAMQRFFHVAGWGKTETKSESEVKLKLKVPLSNRAQCVSTYQAAGINLADSQICAGGERGRDSCNGDSGGPLMTVTRTPEDRLRWTAAGIVSFGPSPCGMQNWPGVYTRVTSFMPWILSKMRA